MDAKRQSNQNTALRNPKYQKTRNCAVSSQAELDDHLSAIFLWILSWSRSVFLNLGNFKMCGPTLKTPTQHSTMIFLISFPQNLRDPARQSPCIIFKGFSPAFLGYGLHLSWGNVKGDELYLPSWGEKSGIFSSDLRQTAYRDTQYLE